MVFGFLIVIINLNAYGQMVFTGADGNFSLAISGEMSGMMTIGLQDEDQAASNVGMEPPGVYFPNLQTGSGAAVGTGKNGYYNNFDLVFIVNPIPNVELYAKFKTRYQTGSPYLPLQLDGAAKEEYAIKTDTAWARVNAVQGMGFELPLDIWLKVGKFKAESSHFNTVTRFAVDDVLNPLQTGTNYAFQAEAEYPVPVLGPLALSLTTHLRLNEALKEYYDVDSEESIISHYDATGLFAQVPLHISLKMNEIKLPFATLQAELLYALNGMHIWSGHGMGAGVGAKIPVSESLTVPVGIGVAFFEKNIDAFTGSAIESSGYESFYAHNGYSKADSYTLGLRQSLRFGFGAGANFSLNDTVKGELNAGFAYSQIAHIYRETLSLSSLSFDLRTVFMDRYILGGGIVLGTLTDAEWKVKEGINQRRPGETTDRELFEGHTFSLPENVGFEVYTGIQMLNARFILGYNMNKGIAMGKYLEALPDAQQKYRQAVTEYSDGMFERGGIFFKLVVSL